MRSQHLIQAFGLGFITGKSVQEKTAAVGIFKDPFLNHLGDQTIGNQLAGDDKLLGLFTQIAFPGHLLSEHVSGRNMLYLQTLAQQFRLRSLAGPRWSQ